MALGEILGNTILDQNGDPVSGAVVRFYEVGTVTPKNVYADEALSILLGTYVVADASGRFVPPYLTNPFKIRVEAALDDATLIYEQDHINQDIADINTQTSGLLTISNVQNSVGTFATTGGASNAYTLTLSQPLSGYTTGQFLKFKANHTNTGAATINISNIGVVSLQGNLGTDLLAGDIVADGVYSIIFDGGVWKLTNSQGTNQATIQVNTINELTPNNGVNIDSALVKDGSFTGVNGTFSGNVQGANVTATTAVITNTISERTAASGVTIDGVLLKDGNITINGSAGVDVAYRIQQAGDLKGVYYYDDDLNALRISRFADVGGAYLGGLRFYEDRALFDGLPVWVGNILKVDTIDEYTTNAGVTIDGGLVKDGSFTGVNGTFSGNIQGANVTATTAIITNTISERTAAAGVTIDGVLLKDGGGALAWHANNDGPSSGMNADKVDDLEASQFLRSDADDITTGLLTFSRASNEQMRIGYNTGGSLSPFIGIYDGLVTRRGYMQASAAAVTLARDGGALLSLGNTGEAVLNGATVWTSGNDGATSGLDADLLDGQQGSYYRDASNLNAGTVPDARLQATGTYTPVVSNVSGATIPINSVARAEYIKIGDLCTVNIALSMGNSPSNDECRMTLPFSANNLQLLNECWLQVSDSTYPTLADADDLLSTDGAGYTTVNHGSGIVRGSYFYFKDGTFSSIGSFGIDAEWLYITFSYRTT